MRWKGLTAEEGTLLIMAQAFLGIPRSVKSCLGAIKKIIFKKKKLKRERERRQHLLSSIYCQINSAAPEMPSVSGERGCHQLYDPSGEVRALFCLMALIMERS